MTVRNMGESSRHKAHSGRRPPPRRPSWCCTFSAPPRSPEISARSRHHNLKPPPPPLKNETSLKSASSFPNSPQSTRLGLVGRMDPRRILSPGRVSPIDSDPTVDSLQEIMPSPIANINAQSRSAECSEKSPPLESNTESAKEEQSLGIFDVRLNLKGKAGGSLVLELNSEVLSANSSVFADLIAEYWKGSKDSAANHLCRIEVPEVENLNVFRETIELMFEEEITKRLLKTGVYRSIDILEVSVAIMFNKGVTSCLKYLEAVPWTEEEEEKLRSLFNRFKFDEATTRDFLARLYSVDPLNSQEKLARQLIWSITTCTDANARNELKSLVKGLLCKSSVYEKNYPDIDKEDLYGACQSCLDSLVSLLEEASGTKSNSCRERVVRKKETGGKSLVERISIEVDSISWLVEIMLDWQIGEEFVDMWAGQRELLKMHESASPMVRYELSRVSALLFIALGTRRLHGRSEARLGLLQAWFNPILLDFGWLQRCRKGLDMRALEEAMGQVLLTLPLRQQYVLFMEWFRCFSKHGTECPNLSKAFQIWWRRSFLRGSDPQSCQ